MLNLLEQGYRTNRSGNVGYTRVPVFHVQLLGLDIYACMRIIGNIDNMDSIYTYVLRNIYQASDINSVTYINVYSHI
jgi:hypothetical protein